MTLLGNQSDIRWTWLLRVSWYSLMLSVSLLTSNKILFPHFVVYVKVTLNPRKNIICAASILCRSLDLWAQHSLACTELVFDTTLWNLDWTGLLVCCNVCSRHFMWYPRNSLCSSYFCHPWVIWPRIGFRETAGFERRSRVWAWWKPEE
jgi:hypothetical protein